MIVAILAVAAVVAPLPASDIRFTTDPRPTTGIALVTEQPIIFVFGGRAMIRVYPDGRVILAPGLMLDEASKRFWNAVAAARHQPPMFPEMTP